MAGDNGGNDEQGSTATEEERILTLEELREKLDALTAKVEQFFTGAGGKTGSPRQPDGQPPAPAATGTGWQSQAQAAEQRRGEIRAELDALKQQEAAEAHAQDLQDRLGKLEKAAEKPPRELRGIEQFFRWGDT